MRKLSIVIMCAVVAAGAALAGDVVDLELVVTSNTNGSAATATCKGVNGFVNSIGVDVESDGTGTVSVALQPFSSAMASRTLYSTNDCTADVWDDPSDAASRRYAVRDVDTFTLSVTNPPFVDKKFRVVVRVETVK